MTITFIRAIAGDWICMYINGYKVAEGHSLREEEVVAKIQRAMPWGHCHCINFTRN